MTPARAITVASAIGLLVAGAACGDNLAAPHDKAAACGLDGTSRAGPGAGTSSSSSALTAVDRKIVGAAAPYAPDVSLHDRAELLGRSIAARRAAAWQVVTRALAPVPLAEPRLNAAFGGQPTVPAWQTWYARDDLARVFKRAYRALGNARRQARAPFTPDELASAFAWNTRAVDELPTWPEQRYLDYLAAIDDPTEVGGVPGVARVGYSPATARHLLNGYPQTLGCQAHGAPAPWVDEPARAPREVAVREQVAADACGWTELGPYMVAAGGQIAVATSGRGDADVYLRRGARPDVDHWDCRSSGDGADERCVLDGGAPVYAAVLAGDGGGGGGGGIDVAVDIAYTEADARDPACVGGELPIDAAVVKAEWRRAQFGATLPVYDTSGPRMAARLRADGASEWGPGDGEADPGSDDIYTVTTPASARYRLAGLHIMTKELEHWMWITLWWSPHPDDDFGADRPAALTGPWRHYKMCVVTDFAENDPDPRGGAAGSLGDALAAVSAGGASSWCSNPYLENGAGNAATNCIGCHQHGGTDLTPEAILADGARFPHQGRRRVRNNIATDYLWAVRGGRGDDLAAIFQAEADYWDAADAAP